MKKILLFTSVSCLLLSSCEKFLDATPGNEMSEDKFWSSPNDVDKFIVNMYGNSFMGRDDVTCIWMEDTMGDDSHLVWNWFVAQYQAVVMGTADAYNNVSARVWEKAYANIRRAWQLLENIDRVEGISPEKKNQYEGEARFMMAYAYHHLVNHFGDVPLVDHVLTITESEEITRAPQAEVVDFILEQLDQASTLLSGADRVYGRLTSGAAQAFKARVLLYQSRWDEVLTVTSGLMGKYTLHTAGETPYYDLFHGSAKRADEIILTIPRMARTGSSQTGTIANRTFAMKDQTSGDPYRSMTPTGPLVDSYPMADGRLIHEEGSTWSPTDPYKDRDPRLEQSITYPTGMIDVYDAGAVVPKLYDPELGVGEMASDNMLYNANEPSATGFVWKKFIDFSLHGMTNLTDCTNDKILIRYAEVLLMRAEALAESQGATAKEEIINLVDQLRDRVKGGKVHRENYNSKEDLVNLVRNERRVELAGEGFRPWDLKRWRLAELDVAQNGYGLKGELYGAYMRRDGTGAQDRVVMVDGVARRYVETRYFETSKHYLLPVPQGQIDLNPNLTQNTGW